MEAHIKKKLTAEGMKQINLQQLLWKGTAKFQSPASFSWTKGLEPLCQFRAQSRAGLRGSNGGNCPGPPAARGIRWWNLFVSNKILVWKISWIRSDTRMQLYVIFLCCIKHQGPQQQLISPQVWLSVSFRNRYWVAYRYFRFCSMQIYFISLLNFS